MKRDVFFQAKQRTWTSWLKNVSWTHSDRQTMTSWRKPPASKRSHTGSVCDFSHTCFVAVEVAASGSTLSLPIVEQEASVEGWIHGHLHAGGGRHGVCGQSGRQQGELHSEYFSHLLWLKCSKIVPPPAIHIQHRYNLTGRKKYRLQAVWWWKVGGEQDTWHSSYSSEKERTEWDWTKRPISNICQWIKPEPNPISGQPVFPGLTLQNIPFRPLWHSTVTK